MNFSKWRGSLRQHKCNLILEFLKKPFKMF